MRGARAERVEDVAHELNTAKTQARWVRCRLEQRCKKVWSDESRGAVRWGAGFTQTGDGPATPMMRGDHGGCWDGPRKLDPVERPPGSERAWMLPS